MSQENTGFRVFIHDDYRSLLRHWMREQPRQGWGQSAKLAQAAGVNTSFMSHVLVGKREFTFDQALRIASAIGLGEFERDYFLTLVEHSRAGTEISRQYWQARLSQLKAKASEVSSWVREDLSLSENAMRIYFSSPVFSSIRILSAIGDGLSLEDIVRVFNLDPVKAAEYVDFLLQTRLCQREGQRIRPGQQIVVVKRGTLPHRQHHINWRIASIRAVDRNDPDSTLITAPLSLSRADLAALREELMVMIKSVSERVRSGTPEVGVCLNLDLFEIVER